MIRPRSAYKYGGVKLVPFVALLVLSWTADRTRADNNGFLVKDIPSEARYIDEEHPLSPGSDSAGEDRLTEILSKSRLLVTDGDGGPETEKRGARGSFRSDLGKRSGIPAELYDVEEGESTVENDLDPAGETSKRRLSGFRSDLGKRYSKFRNDLGKRRSGGRLSGYRTDLGKREALSASSSNWAGGPHDLDEDNSTLNDKSQSEEEVTWKRATFRSDLGKRLRFDAARRVFRADLGKRRAFRSDLG